MSSKNNTTAKPFGIRDKVGYMFGDFGNDFTFIFASSFLMVFYTKVLGISGAAVGTLFLVARCVDAVTDITMGRIVDSCKPQKDGRFRPWIRRMCGPVAIAAFLMYQSGMAGAPMGLKMVYMYVTYLLWGSVFYTSINIPYGSMASAISSDPDERTSLSTFRSIGATLASLVIGVGAPLLIYVKDADGNQIVQGGRFTVIAGVFSVLAVVCYILCYKLTTERVKVETKVNTERAGFGKTVASLFKNRALMAIIGAAIMLLLTQILSQTMNAYLFADYFKSAGALSTMNLIGTALGLALAPAIQPIAKRFGKKEAASVATFIAGACYLVLFFLRVQDVKIYIFLAAIALIGQTFFNMVIWANITDVIDYQEVLMHQRDDGTVYAVYSFARKIGQALAGGLGGYALAVIGYDSLAKVQTESVKHGIYTVSTIVPAVCFIAVALILAFWYPLNKKKVAENVAELQNRKAAGN